MMCADHQGEAQNMAGIGDKALAAGSSGSAAGPNGLLGERATASGTAGADRAHGGFSQELVC